MNLHSIESDVKFPDMEHYSKLKGLHYCILIDN